MKGTKVSPRTPSKKKASPPVSIDMHTHWEPEPYYMALAKLRRGGGGDIPDPLSFDLDKRRRWMDEHGVKMHVLTLSGRMPWHWVPPDVGATLAQILNDANIEAHTAFPDRFVGSVEVSIREPALALKELNRVAGKPGMRTVHLPTSIVGNDYLLEDRYAPFLARCEELGYPLLFHPLDWDENIYGGGEQSRLATPLAKAANIHNTLGFPFEYANLATKFIITGMLDRYPKLDILWPHMGGIFPYIAGRIDHGLWMKKFKLKHPFRDYIRRFHYDTLAYYPETLRLLINLVGSDRVVIGTDNFAIMDVEWPNALVEKLNLPVEERDRILGGMRQGSCSSNHQPTEWASEDERKQKIRSRAMKESKAPLKKSKVKPVAPAAVKAAEELSLAPWTMRTPGPVKPISVDVHTHWAPERYARALAEIGRPARKGKTDPLRVDLEKKLKNMDRCGVQALILGLSGRAPWYWLSSEEGARLAALVNDAAIEAHATFPERFFAAAALPARDPELALKELNRVAGKPGIRAVHLPSSMEARDYLFEPAYEPIFARSEELGYPIVLHQLDEEVNYFGGVRTRIGQPLTEKTFIYNTLGFPMDASTTATMFIITGTLDKYPKLEVVLPHAGGAFPVVAGRIEHGITRRKFKLKHPFRDYLRRFHYDSIIYYPEILRYLIDLVGADRVMIGSDNSYERAELALDQPNALVEHLHLPKAQEKMILRGNAARLFRL